MPSGSSVPARASVPSVTAATSPDWNSGSANTHTAFRERIFCRSSVEPLGARLHVRADRDGADRVEVEASVEILVGVVEDDERFVPQRPRRRLELRRQRINLRTKTLGVGLEPRGMLRIALAEHNPDVEADRLGVVRIEPDVAVLRTVISTVRRIVVVPLALEGPGLPLAQQLDAGCVDERDETHALRQGSNDFAGERLQPLRHADEHAGGIDGADVGRLQREAVGRSRALDQ